MGTWGRRCGAVLLLTVFAYAVAGCGGAATTTSTQATSTSVTTASTTTTTAPATTTSQATTTSVPTTTTAMPTATTMPPTTTTATTQPSGEVLYQITDWSAGMSSWAGSAQWKTVGGMLVTDGSDRSIAVAPVDLRNRRDYAVEAEIQAIKPDSSFFGVLGRLVNGVGYEGGYADYGYMRIRYNGDEIAKSGSFSLDNGWHRYRLEVTQNNIRLLFDGAEVARAIDNRMLDAGTVGIYCDHCQINVRSFRVMGL